MESLANTSSLRIELPKVEFPDAGTMRRKLSPDVIPFV